MRSVAAVAVIIGLDEPPDQEGEERAHQCEHQDHEDDQRHLVSVRQRRTESLSRPGPGLARLGPAAPPGPVLAAIGAHRVATV